ncbi:hypothetical protein [Nonomuraea phyllanthi]|uniref:hypothetical protein n=1 Tax=Nonomuraea phyllanthi TaxID=2219224 RepID=UPI001293297A|nr:hypothetical protein [Nonomuraea phyllanthi]
MKSLNRVAIALAGGALLTAALAAPAAAGPAPAALTGPLVARLTTISASLLSGGGPSTPSSRTVWSATKDAAQLPPLHAAGGTASPCSPAR